MSNSIKNHSATAAASAHVENVRALFGSHPEDVIQPIKTAADVLGWLEETFGILIQEVNSERMSSVRLKRLIDAGLYLTSDFGNHLECEHKRMLESLRLAGVVAAKEGNGHD